MLHIGLGFSSHHSQPYNKLHIVVYRKGEKWRKDVAYRSLVGCRVVAVQGARLGAKPQSPQFAQRLASSVMIRRNKSGELRAGVVAGWRAEKEIASSAQGSVPAVAHRGGALSGKVVSKGRRRDQNSARLGSTRAEQAICK